MNFIDKFREQPSGIQTVIVLVVLVLLTLLIFTLLQWARTPSNQFRLLPRWLWLPVILISQPLGPVLFLGIGRKAAPVPKPEPSADTGNTSDTDIVEVLYGKGSNK